MQKLLEPVTGRPAWKSADLAADDSWRFQFEQRHLDEICALVEMLRKEGARPPAIARHQFSAPAMKSLLTSVRDELESGYGVARLIGLPAERFDLPDLETLFWVMGLLLGQPISQNALGESIVHILDRGVSYGGASARGYTTSAELVPHCDAGPDYTGLLCVHPAKAGGESSIVSSMAIYNEILENHPEYLDVLYRGFLHSLRGEGPTGKPDEVTNHPIPIFRYFDSTLSCSFNSRSMEQVHEMRGTRFTDLERDAIEYILDLAKRPDLRYDMVFERGDIQFLNGYTTLHSRAAYEDFDSEDQKRRLLRLWIIQPDGRPLDPMMADRFNTGPRGAVPVRGESQERTSSPSERAE